MTDKKPEYKTQNTPPKSSRGAGQGVKRASASLPFVPAFRSLRLVVDRLIRRFSPLPSRERTKVRGSHGN